MKALITLLVGAAVSSFSIGFALHGVPEAYAFMILFAGALIMILSLVMMARS